MPPFEIKRERALYNNFGTNQRAPKFECLACGWRERLVLKATNKPTTVKDVVIMAELLLSLFTQKKTSAWACFSR
jgi:hypothetical protein